MKTYHTYLFDFDYTLADSSPGIVTCFRRVLDGHGFTDVGKEQIKRTIGKTLEDSFSELTSITDTETLLAYEREYIEQARGCMTANTRLFPETRRVLSELKDRGARIGIVSTKFRYTITELLERDFPAGFFDVVVGGEDVAEPKPSPEGLRRALEKLGGTPDNTLYVGDSVIDARLAEAAGVDFYGVLHGTTTREELSAYPHVAVCPDLCGLL